MQEYTFQQFVNNAAKEVWLALNKKYEVRNTFVQETGKRFSNQIGVILVTAPNGLAYEEPTVKKFTQGYVEYKEKYDCDIKAWAKSFAEEVEHLYKYCKTGGEQ